ncbi:hypothetical protein ACMA1D_02005 [Streptomyces sp. 796.1]|uniref:hypothetical protein n=1 Tax=Streptomyces sp. 796.1 TaxID=3163029 RepID=UPI0039C973FD
MDVNLAADTGANALGGLGSGGAALVLTAILIAGTKDKGTDHALSKNGAVTVGLGAGTAAAGAGQMWGMPSDIVLSVLTSAGVGSGDGSLGDVTMPAVSLVSVLLTYILKLKPRTAGVTGWAMAVIFAQSGGAWAEISTTIGEMIAQWAG